MHSNIIKLSKCPLCDATCDGYACRCGWTKEKPTGKPGRIYPICKCCEREGRFGIGFCEKHYKIDNLALAISQWLGFRQKGKDNTRIYRQISYFIDAILKTLEPGDRETAGWIDYKKRNLKRIL